MAILLVLPLTLLAGCQSAESRPESADKTSVPITVKLPSYDFSDFSSRWREKGEQWLVENTNDLDDSWSGTAVSARGTWNSQTPLGFPNHSVNITCLRSEGMLPYAHDRNFSSKGICIVAKATLATELGNFLSASMSFYDITKWTFDEVVAVGSEVPSIDCYKEELKFDRKNQQVILLRTTVPGSNKEKCLIEPDKEPLLLYLGCPPVSWPVKSETNTTQYGTFTQYCLPDFDKMTQEQKDAYSEQSL